MNNLIKIAYTIKLSTVFNFLHNNTMIRMIRLVFARVLSDLGHFNKLQKKKYWENQELFSIFKVIV